MSIINDALKKAEQQKHPSAVGAQKIVREFDQLKTDLRRKFLKRWLFWTGTGALCLLGLIVTTTSFKKPVPTTASVSVEETIAAVPAPADIPQPVERTEPPKTISASDFRLNGILYDQQNPLAIINGRIVGKDAVVEGAQLLEIYPDYVRFSFQGQEFTLKIK